MPMRLLRLRSGFQLPFRSEVDPIEALKRRLEELPVLAHLTIAINRSDAG